jgi:transposase
MVDTEREELERKLAERDRLIHRQSLQIERMQDQLQRAIQELLVLRKLLNRPPPPEPTPPANGPKPGPAPEPSGPEPSGPTPDPSPRPHSDKERKKKAKFGRSEIPKDLERVKEELPAAPCPACGGTRTKELRKEVVDIYDYVPAKVVVRQVSRPVCRCRDCQHIAIAPYPDWLAPRLRATPLVIALIIYEKYGRHLPLYRVDMELERLGAQIPEATRDSWLRWAAEELAKLLRALKEAMFAEGLIHTDGTGFPVVHKQGKRRLGQMAVFCNRVGTIYEFTTTKHGVHQRVFLGLEEPKKKDEEETPKGKKKKKKDPEEKNPRFRGYQVADAASVADQTYGDGSIVECGCNAHARRKFEEAEETDRQLAGEALAFWSALYQVEERARDMTPAARLALRRERSVPVAEDLRRWLNQHRGTRLPKEPLTDAMNYLHNHWKALFRFLEDGRIPIDNNFAERQIKAIALGRKNYLYAGSVKAAERAAIFYTFVMTCRQHKVDPIAWLSDVLPRIRTTRPSQYSDLLPMNWNRRWEELLAA